MTTDLIRHAFHGQAVRVITDEHGEPWFVAKDVCAILGIENHRDAMARLDDDEKGVGTTDTLGGPQQVTTVNEPGVYGLTWTSRKPGAAEFRRWIKHDVVPTIARTGSYGSPSFDLTRMSDVELLVQAASTAVARVRELEPPAAAWTAMADSAGDYSLRDAAQILDRDPSIHTGQNRLSEYLRQVGWIDRHSIPYQRHVDLGRITSRVRTYKHPRTGEQMTADPQIRITVKGLGALHKLLGGTQPLDISGRHLVAVGS